MGTLKPQAVWAFLVIAAGASCQTILQAEAPAPSTSIRDALAGAPAPAALTDVAALAATVSSSDGLAAVVSSTSGLAADDCRNLNAVLDNINTAFIGPQRTAVVGPVSVAYRRFGPLRSSERLQKPLVLVIGIACTMSDWTPRLLRALAVDREVIIYDNAGIGQSVISAGQDPSAADYFKFQADTLAGLISELSLDQPDVLGWSLGAKIALHLGVYHSSMFGKLVSDAGSAGGPNSSTAVLDAVDVGMPVVQRLTKLKTLLERPANAATVCQWVLEKEAMPTDGVTSEEIQAQVEAEVAYHTADAGIVAGLPLIKNPTLVITSSNDLTNPPSNQGPIMAGVPGAVLVTFQGCGHLAPFQETDKVVALIDGFLGAKGSFQPEAPSAYTCQGLGLPSKTTR